VIKAANERLSRHNHRNPLLHGFEQYLVERWSVQDVCLSHYRQPIYRRVRWPNWRGRRSADDRHAQHMVDVFGHNAVLAYGNGSGWHALRGMAPTPTEGLRRRLEAKRHLGITVVPTNEYYTTKTCCNCLKPFSCVADRARARPRFVRRRVFDPGPPGGFVWRQEIRNVAPRGLKVCNDQSCLRPTGNGNERAPRRWHRDRNAAINIGQNLLYHLRTGVWLLSRLYEEHAQAQQQHDDDDDPDSESSSL
jgi:hypothetical protein